MDEIDKTNVRKRGRSFLFYLNVTLGCVVVAAGLLYVFFGAHTRKYEPLIAQIAADQLHADGGGRILLKDSFPGLTPHDEMFITRRDDGSFLAMFPTDYGLGIDISGLLYTSRPLQDSDTYLRPLATEYERRLIDVGRWSRLSLDKRIDDHWYRVSRRH